MKSRLPDVQEMFKAHSLEDNIRLRDHYLLIASKMTYGNEQEKQWARGVMARSVSANIPMEKWDIKETEPEGPELFMAFSKAYCAYLDNEPKE